MIDNVKAFQQEIFQRIQHQLGGKDKLIQWLQDNLNLGQASIYRRISGDTTIDLKELLFLTRSFKLPMHEFFETPNHLIYFHLENNQPQSYEEWMEVTHQNFSLVCSQPNVKMYYTSTENPIFHHFHFEALTRFKLYIWARAIWEMPFSNSNNSSKKDAEPFDLNSSLWTDKVRIFRENMLKSYSKIPSVEFCTPNLMNNNLSQIQYYLECYQFANRRDAITLCDELQAMMDLLHEQTQTERKVAVNGVEELGSFELYYNEIIHTNNTLLFTFDTGKVLHTTFGNPTTIKTQQDLACDYALQWFEKLIRRSMKISNSAERDRLRLFKKTEEKIKKARLFFGGLV